MKKTPQSEPIYFATEVSSARRFYLELKPAPGRKTRVVSGGLEVCTDQYDVQRSKFPFLIFELIVGGAGSLTLEKQYYPLNPGTVFVYGGNVTHRIQASPSKALTKYFFAVTEGEVEDWMREAGIRMPSVFQVRNLAELTNLCEVMTNLGRGDSHDRQRLCLATFQYFLLRAGALCIESEGEGGTAQATYRRCRKLIEESFSRLSTVQEIAEACHVAPEYLCRLFRRFRRQTPYQYLQSLKMNRAVELLHSGSYNVKEVATELGFSDTFHFSRSFKRIYGIPPSLVTGSRSSSPVPRC